MKKNNRKVKTLQLNRETLVRLNNEELTKAQGGVLYGNDAFNCTGCDSGCGIID